MVKRLEVKQALASLLLAMGTIGWLLMTLPATAQSLSAKYVPVIVNLAGIAGSPGYSGDNGPATAAQLKGPFGIVYDAAGNLYIADSQNNVIRRVDATTGYITTVAGTGTAGYGGDGGQAATALLNNPQQVAFDTAGNIYIADTGNNRIRKINAQTGIISTIVGDGTSGTFIVGVIGTASPLRSPRSVQVNRAGDIFVASSGLNHVLSIPASTGLTVAYAGVGGGSKSTTTGDGGPAPAATFAGPYNMALDPAGNLYLVDRTNNVIRKVTASTGIISTVAGTNLAAGNTGDGGPATSATLNTPSGAFVDQAGNLYIASTGANTVRVVNAQTGIISTFAGIGTAGSSGVGGAAIAAELNGDQGVAVSPDGSRVAIANTNGNSIQVVYLNNRFPSTVVGSSSPAQTINVESTTAGTASSFQLGSGLPGDFSTGMPTGCPGAMVAFKLCTVPVTFAPMAPGLRNSRIVLTDSVSNRYIFGLSGTGTSPAAAFTPGTLSSFAGTGTTGSTGDGGAAGSATVNMPGGVALDATGDLYIADTANDKVRVVNAATGNISTFAGIGTTGFSGDGAAAVNAELNKPASVSLDAAGNLYIADTANNRIRRVSAQTGTISTVAGMATSGNSGDGGVATAATLNSPHGVAADSNGSLYIADSGNNKIRQVNVYTGLISTIAGTGAAGNSGNGVAATTATLANPEGVALDASGNIYIADTGNNQIRKIAGGIITTIAGTGATGFTGDGGPATTATLNAPTAISVDAAGDVYITDTGNSCIRIISAASGEITTIAGTGDLGLSGNGGPSAAAQLRNPSGIAVDALGNYYIADTANNRVALVDAIRPDIAFGSVNKDSASDPHTISLLNIGNQNLVLSGLSVSPSQYQQVSGAATDCTTTSSLTPGASCQIRITFNPVAEGSVTGAITLTNNALNVASAVQTINLTGNGITVGAATTIAVATGTAQTAGPLGTFPVLLQALVTDARNYPVSGVVVTFAAPATGSSGTFANTLNAVSVTTDGNGIATASILTANGNRGSFSITATVAGVATPAVFTETIAGNITPALTLNAGAGTIQYGQNETVTVSLAPATLNGVAATGTVTLYDNGTAVGTKTVVSGAVSITYVPNAGTRVLTASYSGDSDFSASTTTSFISLVVTPLPVTGTISPLTLPYGSSLAPVTGILTGVLSKDADNVKVVFAPTTSAQTLDVGQYPLNENLTGSAADNYVVTITGSPTLTITQAATVTSLSATNLQPSLGASTTLTATVTSTVNGASPPVGAVVFYNGSTNLGTVSLNAGKANLAISTLPAGVQSITAVYAGNTNNSGSTAAALAITVVAADYSIAISTSSATIQQGDRVNIALTVAGNQAFTGTVSFSCSGLPANSTCTFTPATIIGNGTALLTIATAGQSTGGLSMLFRGAGTALATLFLPGILLGGLVRRSKLSGISRALFVVVGMVVCVGIAGGLSGCGSKSTATNTVNTPVGQSTVSIITRAGSITHVTSFALNVTKTQ